MKRKLVTALLLSALLLVPANAYASPLEEANATKEAAQEGLKGIEEEMGQIKERQEQVRQSISKLGDNLVDVMVDISILEDEIAKKKEEIKKTEKDYEKAKEEERLHYNAMKLRIQYMYENSGSTSIMDDFLSRENISQSLNKTTLHDEMYGYDRKQLEEYEASSNKVKEIADKLREGKEELEENEGLLKEEQKKLEKKLKKKKEKEAGYENDMENAKQLAEEYQKTIEEQNEIIRKQMEEQRKAFYGTRVGAYDPTFVAKGSGTGTDIANYALQFLGNPYVYGGTSLTNGIDCSAFVQAVYANFGYSLPRTSESQRYVGREVHAGELQPGDIICYSGHVAIYIGEGKIVHASSAKTGIKISNNFQYKTVITMRRVAE